MKKPLFTLGTKDYMATGQPVSFIDTAGATFGYKYAPLTDSITEQMLFGNVALDPEFDFMAAAEEYGPNAKHLAHAKNQDHFDYLKNRLDANLARRSVLDKSGFFASIGAELIDPLNIAFGLPVLGRAGLLTTSRMAAGEAAYVGAKAGFAAGAVLETARAPFDPLATTSEVALNVGASTLFGGLFSGAFAGVMNLGRTKFAAMKKAENAFDEVTYADAYLGDTVSDIPVNYGASVSARQPVVQFDGETIQVDQRRIKEDFYKFEWTKPDFEYEKPIGRDQIDSVQMFQDWLVHRAALRKDGWDESLLPKIEAEKIQSMREKLSGMRGNSRVDPKAADRLEKAIDVRLKKAKGKWATDTSTEALERVTRKQDYRSTPNTFFSDGFPNSAVFKAVSTPVNDVMRSGATPRTKGDILLLSGSSSLPTERNSQGFGGMSFYNKVMRRQREPNLLIAELENIFVEMKTGGQRVEAARFAGQSFTGNDFEKFFEDVVSLRMDLEANPSAYDTYPDGVKKAIDKIDTFFDNQLEQLQDVGLLPDVKNVRVKLKQLNEELERIDLEAEKTVDQDILQNYADVRAELIKEIKFFEGMPEMTKNKRYFPRNYRVQEILADDAMKEDFTNIWTSHFERFPVKRVWDEEAGEFVENTKSAREFAEQIVERILHNEPFVPYSTKPDGFPRSKHLFQRVSFDIPDAQMKRFIYTDPTVLQDYGRKAARTIEWRNTFGGKTIDDMLRDIEIREKANGLSTSEINKIKKAFVIDFDRAMGNFYEDPSRWDNRIARLGKAAAQVAYLPKAGIATLGDVHGIIGARGFGKTFQPLMEDLSRNAMRLNKADLQKLSDSYGYGQVGSVNRFSADNTELRRAMRDEVITNKALKMYHTLPFGSLLHASTRLWRGWHGSLIMSEFIEKAINIRTALDAGQTPATSKKLAIDVETLAQYGIDIDTARLIAGYENAWSKEGSIFAANMSDWPVDTSQQRRALQKYSDAVEAHINNTIIFAQLADKPAFADGAFYVKYKPWMSKFGVKPDRRIETDGEMYGKIGSGLIGWPLVFWSYSLAALPRVMGRLADPMREHRLSQAMAALATGSMVVVLRNLGNPDYFEYKEPQDLLHRAIDYSGLTSVYGDIFNMGLHMAFGAGVIDQEKSFLSGHYRVGPEDVATTPLGAPVGVFQGFYDGATALMEGDTREGVAEISRSLPKLGPFGFYLDMEDFVEAFDGYED